MRNHVSMDSGRLATHFAASLFVSGLAIALVAGCDGGAGSTTTPSGTASTLDTAGSSPAVDLWKKVTAVAETVSIQMPGEPKMSEAKVPLNGTTIDETCYKVEYAGGTFALYTAPLPAGAVARMALMNRVTQEARKWPTGEEYNRFFKWGSHSDSLHMSFKYGDQQTLKHAGSADLAGCVVDGQLIWIVSMAPETSPEAVQAATRFVSSLIIKGEQMPSPRKVGSAGPL